MTVTSTSDDPSDPGSLRYALDHATPGEAIDFAPDVRTIDLSNTLNSAGLTIGVNLSIINDQGIGPVTIDGGGSFADLTVSDASVTASLSGLNIVHGIGTKHDGGGILTFGTLQITDCGFSNNDGAAISNGGTMTISNSSFSNNPGDLGGAVANYATLIVNDSTFSGNSASGDQGGAVYNGGTTVLSGCTFSNNSAEYGGGIENGGTLAVRDCTFSNNSAKYTGGVSYGGGIDNNGTLTISDSTFANNFAGVLGGGVNNSTDATLAITDSTFSGNSVGRTAPSPAVSGGGIYAGLNSSFVTLNGDIVCGNFSTLTGITPDDLGGLVGLSSSHNVIGTGGSGGLIAGDNGNQVGVAAADAGLGPLADNGGPTQTFAIGSGSFALGRGVTQTTATTDQRGVARPIGQPSDVGAFQYSASPTVTANPANQLIGVGQSMSFSATASDGAPTPTTVQWQVSSNGGNSFANLSDGGPYAGSASTTLTISNAAAGLSGDQYRALFSNAAGLSATTAAATLTVASISVAGGSPQNTIIGTSFGAFLQAKVVDGLGAPLANVPVAFTAPATGPTGAFGALTTVLTNALGIATAPGLTANHITGSFTVAATAAGIVSPADFTLTNTAVPFAIKPVAGSNQHAAVNTAYKTALQARVTDSHGKPVAGITIIFELPAGASGVFSGSPAAVTNAKGVATAPALKANTTAGTFTVSAWVASVDSPANFTLDNTPLGPSAVNVFGGTNQVVELGHMYSMLLVQVVDQFGNPVRGVKVSFAAPATGASLRGKKNLTVTTNTKGLAAISATANDIAGQFQVKATVAGIAMPAIFDLKNVG